MITSTDTRRLWVWLAGAQIALTAWTVYMLVFLPGRIGRVGLLQCVIGVAVVAVAVSYTPLTAAGKRIPAVVMGLAWAVLCFGLGVIADDLWLYATIMLMTGLTGALTMHTLYPDAAFSNRAAWIGLLVVGVGVYVVRAWGLSVYPAMEPTDEGWLLSFAQGYENNGYLTAEFTQGYTRYQDVIVPRILLLLTGWLRLTGFGYVEGRLFFLLLCVMVVIVTAFATREMYNTGTAFFVAAALISSMVLAQSGRVRYEVGVALCIAVSLLLVAIANRTHRRAWLVAAGAAMGMGAFAHLHTAPLGIVMAIALFVPRLRGNIRGTAIDALLYGMGGLTVALVYVLVQVNIDPELYFDATLVRAADDTSNFFYNLRGHIRNVYWHAQLEYLLILAGMGFALLRRREYDISLVLIVVLGHVTLGLITSDPAIHYVRVLAPVYALLVGAMLSEGFSHIPQPGPMQIPAARALVLLALLGTTLAAPLRYVANGGPLRGEAPEGALWLRDNAPADAVILGSHAYYLWLADFEYVSNNIPRMLENHLNETIDADALWQDINPDYVIMDYESPGWMRPQSVTDYIEANGYALRIDFEGAAIYERP